MGCLLSGKDNLVELGNKGGLMHLKLRSLANEGIVKKRCRRCGEYVHNCKNELELDKDQTKPVEQVVTNKRGRQKIRPQRVVWDPETGTTKVFPNKGLCTGVIAKERVEMLKGAKMAKAAKQAKVVDIKAVKQATASVSGGRGRDRANCNGNEGGGRGRGRVDGNEGGRGNGIGGKGGDPAARHLQSLVHHH
ncbi:hypothetical protein FRX31_019254 [Thalictrum thalictroides]|uniref:Uncharacterized protein n=1 Tax=Thalictrum thalictroides TaxID=46969 RepID=A0A7J6W2Y8_THATH|nr:hypothetical protein FRX31_019254 [Thalictrum thalictroides]